jgi:hypothetical protein
MDYVETLGALSLGAHWPIRENQKRIPGVDGGVKLPGKPISFTLNWMIDQPNDSLGRAEIFLECVF